MNQPLPLSAQLEVLENLQELDLKIDQLKKNKAAFPAVLKALEEGYQKANTAYLAKQTLITEIEKTQKQTQAALELNQDRATRAASKLEGVQNSHEFQAANKEIDQLKKLNTNLEEQLKKLAQDKEAGQTESTQLSAALEKAQAERDAKAQEFISQESKLDAEISAITRERDQYTPKVERRILGYYDRIRGGRAGLGIVPAVGGRCSGCNMMLPPQLYNMVQKATELQNCPSCQRILFMPKTGSSESAK